MLGVSDTEPEPFFPPDHPPDAKHCTALVVDQVSVVDCPAVMDVGFAVSDTVGGAVGVVVAMVTVTLRVAVVVVPMPIQLIEYVLVTEVVVLTEPCGAPPVAKPVPVHPTVLLADHVSVVDCPAVTEAGFAVSETVGLVAGSGGVKSFAS